MIIEEIAIRGFGKLEDFHLSFQEGFNLFYGDNEFGKSTLLSFIRTMFYGFSGRNSQRVKESSRQKFLPWEARAFGGSIRFRHQDQLYLLERSFGQRKAEDKVNLTFWDSGTRIGLAQKEPGEYLFAVSEAEFVNTVFVGQLASNLLETDKETADISARLSNLQHSGNENYSYEDVRSRLTQAAARLEAFRGKGGLIFELSAELDELQIQQEQADQVALELEKLEEHKESLLHEKNRLTAAFELEHSRLSKLQSKVESLGSEQNRIEILLKTTQERFALEERIRLERETEQYRREKQLQENVSRRRKLKEGALAELAYTETEISRLAEEDKLLENVARAEEAETLEVITALTQRHGELSQQVAKQNTIVERQRIHSSSLEQQAKMLREHCVRQKEQGRRSFLYPGRLQIIACLFLFSILLALAVILKDSHFLWGGLLVPLAILIFVYSFMRLRRIKQQLSQLEQTLVQGNQQIKAATEARDNLVDELEDIEQRLEILDLKRKSQIESRVQGSRHRGELLAMTKERFLAAQHRLAELETLPEQEGFWPEEDSDIASHQDKDERVATKALIAELYSQMEQVDRELVLTTHQRENSAILCEEHRALITENRLALERNQARRDILALRLEELKDVESALIRCKERLEAATFWREGAVLALQILEESYREMEQQFAPEMNQKAGEYLEALTGGVYKSLRVDRYFMVEVAGRNGYDFHKADYFSGGTTDQIYLALRLAIADIIRPDEEKMPLLLDDALIQYDDRRAAYALGLLLKLAEDRQVILLSCKNGLMELYEEIRESQYAGV